MTWNERERELRSQWSRNSLAFLDAWHRASGRPRGELPPRHLSADAVIQKILQHEFGREQQAE